MTDDEATNQTIEVGLPAQADIRSGEELLARCRAALEAPGDVLVSCEGVERIDAAVLQCLAALADALDGGGRRLVLVDPTPAVDRAIGVLGFGDVLAPAVSPVSAGR